MDKVIKIIHPVSQGMTKSLTKEELINKVASELGISITEATQKFEDLSNAMQRISTISTPSIDDISMALNPYNKNILIDFNNHPNPQTRKFNNKKFR